MKKKVIQVDQKIPILTELDTKTINNIHNYIISSPFSFSVKNITDKFNISASKAVQYLDYLSGIEREFDVTAKDLRGIRKVKRHATVDQSALFDIEKNDEIWKTLITLEVINKENRTTGKFSYSNKKFLDSFNQTFGSNSEKILNILKRSLDNTYFYETLEFNTDVNRDYDFRATNEGGRDYSPKNTAYYIWSWIDILENRCSTLGIENNKTVLITHDGRKYDQEIVDAAIYAARLRGYDVVFGYADQGIDNKGNPKMLPSCVSAFSHQVRVAKPAMSVFLTASHVSRPIEDIVVGTKVSFIGKSGLLESMTTYDIKITTPKNIKKLMDNNKLNELMQPLGNYKSFDVGESHTNMAVLGVLSALGYVKGETMYSIAQKLNNSPNINAKVQEELGKLPELPMPFRGIKAAIEGSNTSSGILMKKALEMLGADTTILNAEVIPIEGEHTADPSINENLEPMIKVMNETFAEFGIAFDLDGDRGSIVIRSKNGESQVLAPDKVGQLLLPFLMKEGGYSKAIEEGKPVAIITDCLSTKAIHDEAKRLGIETFITDAGYVYLKAKARELRDEGYVVLGYFEASGHTWLDYTGEYENPITVGLLFAAMAVNEAKKAHLYDGNSIQTGAIFGISEKKEIPYHRDAPRFQPEFGQKVIDTVAALPENDTGWKSNADGPIPQKLIGLARSVSIKIAEEIFKAESTFETPIGRITVDEFEKKWDDQDKIWRFGKINFTMNGTHLGSFVTRGSSNDPTAVQVAEVAGFDAEIFDGTKISKEEAEKRYAVVVGLVLEKLEQAGAVKLSTQKPSKNMEIVLPIIEKYRAMQTPV
ncbi:MAG: hypothetical protein DKM50_10000 [Candidatus Margulisiibacteriota bacterium]|nr:MAG: hypothetical protein A2X43_04085 [Candidatus Margulisbacteria bacterium GWD2_39_127]OGI05180.1 MAG: hypothetical protein A2X42_02595 [Candidatus Margulisbacteria bacterium GWF2_38_17]OGI06229.1 MAG: hypothetical protein A2X41_08175 [Candidatus Margulisbacteria bacterium GWE2_39_32]PZM78885.1 MAG: hypothetical protein DKM50_10000 [Candidatus Margulisiibacteriota bacterium]HAR64533.1 hypothetical protein [Candidatus Margulisiibacteriota bacterium]